MDKQAHLPSVDLDSIPVLMFWYGLKFAVDSHLTLRVLFIWVHQFSSLREKQHFWISILIKFITWEEPPIKYTVIKTIVVIILIIIILTIAIVVVNIVIK